MADPHSKAIMVWVVATVLMGVGGLGSMESKSE